MEPDPASAYYDVVRTELLDLFAAPPRRLLDVGCGAGATCAAAKARWPACTTIGIEVVPAVAERARRRVDRVVVGAADALAFDANGISEVDGVLLADVLEHLADPWSFLERLRNALAPDAVVVASLPNVANLLVIEALAAGRFDYEESGLLDRTHLRFFTRASIATLFTDAGYRIDRWERAYDGRVDDLLRRHFLGRELRNPIARWLVGRRTLLRGVDAERLRDLRTFQYYVVATLDALGGELRFS